MFQRFICTCFLMVTIVFFSTAAFAGKMELTTYYPAPYGEYKEIKTSKIETSDKLTVPVKNVVAGTSPTVVGEIWVQDDTRPVAT